MSIKTPYYKANFSMKKELKKALPNVLFVNAQKDKRFKAELTKSFNVRLSFKDHAKIKELVKKLGSSQSNILRYFINDGLANLQNKIYKLEKAARQTKLF